MMGDSPVINQTELKIPDYAQVEPMPAVGKTGAIETRPEKLRPKKALTSDTS